MRIKDNMKWTCGKTYGVKERLRFQQSVTITYREIDYIEMHDIILALYIGNYSIFTDKYLILLSKVG